jgi:hypothetical protein
MTAVLVTVLSPDPPILCVDKIVSVVMEGNCGLETVESTVIVGAGAVTVTTGGSEAERVVVDAESVVERVVVEAERVVVEIMVESWINVEVEA